MSKKFMTTLGYIVCVLFVILFIICGYMKQDTGFYKAALSVSVLTLLYMIVDKLRHPNTPSDCGTTQPPPNPPTYN